MDFALALWAAADTETVSTMSTVAKISINVLLLILGLNALIIVHEFGHFAVARLCGVRCEKFYIWFDFWGLKFFKFKWGDTEYGLGVFPLGGYVKMLGQEDNPGELKAEMERARAQKAAETLQDDGNPNIQEDSVADTEPVPTRPIEQLNEELFAPDSYLAKSVPQRMAIIVAGVVMNFLFAIVCATAAYMVGVKETAPSVGNVIPGSPAWEAGLLPGDRIKAINGNPTRVFSDIQVAMVGGENGVKLTIERPESDAVETLEKTLIPRKRKTDLTPSIGVTSLGTLELASAKMPVYPWAKKFYDEKTIESLKKNDLFLFEVEGVAVTNYARFLDEQLKKFDQSISCRFVAKSQTRVLTGDGKSPEVSGDAATVPAEEIDATLPAIPMKEIGVRFQMGPITMVLRESDAARKGIEVGDVLLSVDGDKDFDPLKLPQIILRKVNDEQQSVELVVRKQGGQEKTVSVDLAPIRVIPGIGPLSMKDPVGSTALGFSWNVEPIVAGLKTDVSGEAVDIPILGRVKSVTFLNSESLLKSTSFAAATKEGFKFSGIGEKIDIPYIFDVLLQIADSKEPTAREKEQGETKKEVGVRLEMETTEGKTFNVDLPIVDSKDWFNMERGLLLKAETTTLKIDGFGEALSMGTAKMVDYSLSVFKFLRGLFDGNVSPRALGGPVMIVQAAYMFVERGMGSYLLFLCLIGANLAVINILPIPVLDGGHLVFLLYEGIFRKPPNENVMIILSYLGLFLILTLMVWAISLDVSCIKRF